MGLQPFSWLCQRPYKKLCGFLLESEMSKNPFFLKIVLLLFCLCVCAYVCLCKEHTVEVVLYFSQTSCVDLCSFGLLCGLVGSLAAYVFDCWTLEMEQISFTETSATNYESTLCNIPEERRHHSRHGGSLKSSTALLFARFAKIIMSSPKWHTYFLQTC